MFLNQSDHDAMSKKYIKVLDELSMADIVVKTANKYRDLYGEWGLIFVRYVTPYFWVFPFIAAILLMISFNRLKLFGPMQKCLVAIMAIDVFFLLMTGLKDFVFNALNWNHGFIEYKGCMFMLIFIRIQTVIYGTSLWIKSLMLIQRVLMLISPFNACVIEDEEDFFVGSFYSLIQWISVFSQIVYFTTLPICIHCICTILLIVIVRKEINRLSLLTSTSKALKNLNYKF